MPRLARRHDALRDPFDAGRVGNGRATVFLHDKRSVSHERAAPPRSGQPTPPTRLPALRTTRVYPACYRGNRLIYPHSPLGPLGRVSAASLGPHLARVTRRRSTCPRRPAGVVPNGDAGRACWRRACAAAVMPVPPSGGPGGRRPPGLARPPPPTVPHPRQPLCKCFDLHPVRALISRG